MLLPVVPVVPVIAPGDELVLSPVVPPIVSPVVPPVVVPMLPDEPDDGVVVEVELPTPVLLPRVLALLLRPRLDERDWVEVVDVALRSVGDMVV